MSASCDLDSFERLGDTLGVNTQPIVIDGLVRYSEDERHAELRNKDLWIAGTSRSSTSTTRRPGFNPARICRSRGRTKARTIEQFGFQSGSDL